MIMNPQFLSAIHITYSEHKEFMYVLFLPILFPTVQFLIIILSFLGFYFVVLNILLLISIDLSHHLTSKY